MLIALGGITGVGKSFFATRVSESTSFNRITTIRTRRPRPGEQDGGDTLFRTKEELDEMERNNELAIRRELLGNEYAYLASEVYSDKNLLMELYYTFLKEWKEIRPDLKAIYILPSDIEIAKDNLRARKLSPEREKIRMDDLIAQYELFQNHPELLEPYDVVFTNYFDEDSVDRLRKIILDLEKNETAAKAEDQVKQLDQVKSLNTIKQLDTTK